LSLGLKPKAVHTPKYKNLIEKSSTPIFKEERGTFDFIKDFFNGKPDSNSQFEGNFRNRNKGNKAVDKSQFHKLG
jgi:hypothetical protein